jgi:hypothetical protein
MRVVAIRRHRPPDVRVTTIRPLPKPGPGERLIRVAGAGVNRLNCPQRRGLCPSRRRGPRICRAGSLPAPSPPGGRCPPPRDGAEICALLTGGGHVIEDCPAPAAQPAAETGRRRARTGGAANSATGERAAEAQQMLEANAVRGKRVLSAGQ